MLVLKAGVRTFNQAREPLYWEGVGPSRSEGGVDGLLRKVVSRGALAVASSVGGTKRKM
jgi:hypothetical protein